MRKLKLAHRISQQVLSSLENDILEILWRKRKARVREVYKLINRERKIAHTSIAVILDRMHDKKLVKRDIETCRGGFRYIYFPSEKKEDFRRAAIQTAVDKLISAFGSTAVNYFNERFGEEKR